MPDNTTLYKVNSHATVGQLKALALRAKSAVSDAIAALPVEMFLDATKTKFVGSFAFNATTYPGTENPGLDGKAVLVLAMNSKDNVTGNVTTNYSFLDMNTLVTTYSAKAGDSAKVLNIGNFEIEFKIDSATHNKARITDNGLMVDVRVTGATNGHIAGLDGDGNLTDSGVAASDVVTKVATPTVGAIPILDANGKLAGSTTLLSSVQTAISGGTPGNLSKLDEDGKLIDSGILAANVITTADVATDDEVTSMLNEVFGTPTGD